MNVLQPPTEQQSQRQLSLKCGPISDANPLNLSNLVPTIILYLRSVTKQFAINRATDPAVRMLGIAEIAMHIANAIPA